MPPIIGVPVRQCGPLLVSYYVRRRHIEKKCLEEIESTGIVVLTGPRGVGKSQVALVVADDLSRQHNYTTHRVDGSSAEEMTQMHRQLGTCANDDTKILIIDGATQKTVSILHRIKQTLHAQTSQLILIVTTLDDNLDFIDPVIDVPGLSFGEFSQLIQKLSSGKHLIPEDLEKEFHEVLEGNPLDLYHAIWYMKCSSKFPACLLNSLQRRDAYTLPNEASMFKENEYGISLQKAVTNDLLEIMDKLENFPAVKQALYALAFFSNENIPIEVFPTVFSGSGQYDVVDALLSEIRTYSLGKVEGDEYRLLTLNKVVQRALLSMMNDDQKQQSQEFACKVLTHLCHKDNRDKSDYQSQVDVEPHVESVLSPTKVKKSVSVTIQKVWLLSTWGHYHIQTEKIDRGEAILEQAIKVIEKDFFNGKIKLRDLQETDVNVLFELCHSDEAKTAISEFVQSLRISTSDKSKWASLAPSLNKNVDNKIASLTPELYEELVENDCAYDINKVVQYFIAEEVATVLYSYGRIFLYNRIDRERKQKALEVSKMICQSIEKEFGVKLLHTELVDRNGLLCFLLKTANNEPKSQERMSEDAADAVRGYEKIMAESCNRYEFGILKGIGREKYHKIVCLRYLVKAYKILYQANNDDDKSKCKKELLDCIHEIDILTGDKGSSVNLQRNTSYQTEIASALAALNEEKYMLDAKKRLENVCDVEMRCPKINYPWMEAMEGLYQLGELWAKQDGPKKALPVLKQADKRLRCYITRSQELEGYTDNTQSAQNLMKKVKELSGTLQNQTGDNVVSLMSLTSTEHSSLSSYVDLSPPGSLGCSV